LKRDPEDKNFLSLTIFFRKIGRRGKPKENELKPIYPLELSPLPAGQPSKFEEKSTSPSSKEKKKRGYCLSYSFSPIPQTSLLCAGERDKTGKEKGEYREKTTKVIKKEVFACGDEFTATVAAFWGVIGGRNHPSPPIDR